MLERIADYLGYDIEFVKRKPSRKGGQWLRAVCTGEGIIGSNASIKRGKELAEILKLG